MFKKINKSAIRGRLRENLQVPQDKEEENDKFQQTRTGGLAKSTLSFNESIKRNSNTVNKLSRNAHIQIQSNVEHAVDASSSYSEKDLELLRKSLQYSQLKTQPLAIVEKDRDEILMAKKKREFQQRKTNNTSSEDTIPLHHHANDNDDDDDSEKDDDTLQEPIDEPVEEFEDYNQNRLAFGNSAIRKAIKVERDQMRRQILEVNSDDDENDEDAMEFERAQLLKAGGNVNFLQPKYSSIHLQHQKIVDFDLEFEKEISVFDEKISGLQLDFDNKFSKLDTLLREKQRLEQQLLQSENVKHEIENKLEFFEEFQTWLDGFKGLLETKTPLLPNKSVVKDLFSDVSNEYSSIDTVLERFNAWLKQYPNEYNSAFIHLSLADVLDLYIKQLVLLEGCEKKELNEYKWWQIVSNLNKETTDRLIERSIVPLILNEKGDNDGWSKILSQLR